MAGSEQGCLAGKNRQTGRQAWQFGRSLRDSADVRVVRVSLVEIDIVDGTVSGCRNRCRSMKRWQDACDADNPQTRTSGSSLMVPWPAGPESEMTAAMVALSTAAALQRENRRRPG